MDTEIVREFKEETFSPAGWNVIEEIDEATGKRRMRIQGQVQEADVVNSNKRFYPRDVLQLAVDGLMEEVKVGRGFGEVDHPEVKGTLRNSAHRLTNVWWDKDGDKDSNRLMGEVLVFNTPAGQILQEIIHAGGRPGFSSRGSGKATMVKMPDIEGEVERIEKGFKLESFDFVINPSVSRAQITKIIESVQDGNSQKEEPMKLDELKAQQPELVAELKKEHEAEVQPQIEALTKEIDSLKVKITSLETEMTEKDGEINKHLETVTLVQKTLSERGYVIPAPAAPDPDASAGEDEEKKALATELAKAKGELATATEALTAANTKLGSLEEATKKAELAAYVQEKVSTTPFKALYLERMKGCATKEEADSKFEELKSFAATVISEGADITQGKGVGKKVIDGDDSKKTEEAVREKMKATAGINSKKE